MAKIPYITKTFKAHSLDRIAQAEEIIDEYAAKDLDLTLRQLYYQFVARGLLPNKQSEYKKLGTLVSDARLAGLLDWNAIVDRTRKLIELSHWDSPGSILRSAAYSYRVDKWQEQPYRPEVWIEKDALTGLLGRVCAEWDVPYFSCRGYNSQSEMWRAGQRMIEWLDRSQQPIVLHLGDHDPSGIDMTRDIKDRLNMFAALDGRVEVLRIALTWDQIEELQPPPNPAKLSDSRGPEYVAEYGHDSWELDALDPEYIYNLIDERIKELVELSRWKSYREQESREKAEIEQVAEDFDRR